MTEQRRIVREAVIAADAGSIAEFVWSHVPDAELIGLESGPSSAWLFHALRAEGLPVVVIDARHARAVLSLRINKTDRNDAVGLAELLVSGWYKPVTVKSLESHRVRTVLTNRALLVGIRQDLENQVRSVLETFGFVLGKGRGSFVDRVSEILAGKRLMLRLVRPLLKALAAIREQLLSVDKEALATAGQERHLPAPDERARGGGDHRPRLQDDNRQSVAFQQLRQGRRLSRLDAPALRLGRDRSRRPHLQMR
jgi:transposase